MSRSKGFLPPHKTASAADTTDDFTSSVTDIRGYDDVSIQVNATGDAVGVFTVDGSLDQVNFVPLALDPVPTLDGADKQILIDMGSLSFPFIRTSYVATSGTAGSADVWISGKAI